MIKQIRYPGLDTALGRSPPCAVSLKQPKAAHDHGTLPPEYIQEEQLPLQAAKCGLIATEMAFTASSSLSYCGGLLIKEHKDALFLLGTPDWQKEVSWVVNPLSLFNDSDAIGRPAFLGFQHGQGQKSVSRHLGLRPLTRSNRRDAANVSKSLHAGRSMPR